MIRKPAVPKTRKLMNKKSPSKKATAEQYNSTENDHKAEKKLKEPNCDIIEYASEALQKAKVTLDEAETLLEQKNGSNYTPSESLQQEVQERSDTEKENISYTEDEEEKLRIEAIEKEKQLKLEAERQREEEEERERQAEKLR